MADINQLLDKYKRELDGYFAKGGPNNLEDRDAVGNTPLIFSVYRGLAHEAEMLIMAGADISARGEYGLTALHVATKSADVEMIGVLLRHKADLTARDSLGRTPIDIANSFLEDDVRKRVGQALQSG
jgi:ankyrin repeat protein